jgi:Signal peptide peptidase
MCSFPFSSLYDVLQPYADLIGYAGIGILALFPIYFGSFESLPHPKKARDTEILSTEDAYWFPVLGSLVLFGFYLVFHFLSKELVNMLILFYFSMVGTATVYHLFAPILRSIVHGLLGYTQKEFESEVDAEATSNDKEAAAKITSKKSLSKKKKKKQPKSMSFTESILEPLEFKFLYNEKSTRIICPTFSSYNNIL